MKLAEFKRTIKSGDFVTVLETPFQQQWIGVRRKVLGINSVDLLIETEKDGILHKSHAALPKAADFECNGETFSFIQRSAISGLTGKITWKWERAESPTLPPDIDGLNGSRAQWAKVALQAFVNETGVDYEDALGDLLGDLMHLSDREPFDFEAALERARGHYVAETGEAS